MKNLPAPIATYTPEKYLRHFLPEPAALAQLLTAEAARFFIVPVEQLYPLFARALPPARATAHTCLFLTSGAATMHVGPETHTIGPGEVLLVRAGQVYSFQPGDTNTGFLCHFHDEMLGGGAAGLAGFDLLHFGGPAVVRPDAAPAGFVAHLLLRLLTEYDAHRLQRLGLLRAYLLALVHELHHAATASGPARQTAALALATRFKHLVATSLKALPRVSDYAAQLHVTPNHLAKCVRTATGKAPARWIEESAVLEAKVLLGQTAWPVGAVAAEVGVADASYFSRLFRKHTGVSPLAYRKLIEKS